MQVKDFKEGRRTNEVMSPLALPIARQDMIDVANYSSAQTAKSSSFKAEASKIQLGKAKADETLSAICNLGGYRSKRNPKSSWSATMQSNLWARLDSPSSVAFATGNRIPRPVANVLRLRKAGTGENCNWPKQGHSAAPAQDFRISPALEYDGDESNISPSTYVGPLRTYHQRSDESAVAGERKQPVIGNSPATGVNNFKTAPDMILCCGPRADLWFTRVSMVSMSAKLNPGSGHVTAYGMWAHR
jgi:hypothetical protein